MSNRRYLIISPCRDEAEFAARAIESVLAQTVHPALWIIVDDGSTDQTPEIIERYAAEHSLIKVLRRDDRGRRAVGPGVVDAFYAGLEAAGDLDSFEYLCKLDLDLELPPRYFENLIERMEADPRLGTCSGKPYSEEKSKGRKVEMSKGGEASGEASETRHFDASTFRHFDVSDLRSERTGDEMSAGMTKFYRVSCFQQIGGFVREVMWDGIDCHRCRMLGWKARSWDEPELRFLHLRPMGSSQKSIWSGRARHGYGQWFMGTGFAYITASALYRMTSRPLILGGLAMWAGYVEAMLRRWPRYHDPEFRRFVRSFQWQALLRGKARAAALLEERNARKWCEPKRNSAPQRDGAQAQRALDPLTF